MKEKSPLCEKGKNESHALLKCTETKRWREWFCSKKWLKLNEETAHKKIISNTKILELENLGKFLYKTQCKWGKWKNLCRSEKKCCKI